MQNCLFVLGRAIECLNFFARQPIAKSVGIVRPQHQSIVADLAAQIFQSIDVVHQRVEVKIFQVRARWVGCLRRTDALAGCELLIEAAEVIGQKAAAMEGANFQIRKSIEQAAVQHVAE